MVVSEGAENHSHLFRLRSTLIEDKLFNSAIWVAKGFTQYPSLILSEEHLYNFNFF